LYSYNGSFLFRFTSPALGSIPYREALFNSDFSTGKIHLHRPVYPSGQPIDPLEYPLDELLVLNYLSRGRGVGIQACGVVNSQGHGYLFLDQTGAGKSATARPWIGQPQQFMVLADDRIILRRQEGFLWMYSAVARGYPIGLASPRPAEKSLLFAERAEKRTGSTEQG
jgi:hypothetical protein